jgi:O-antigen biosynthesis protein
MMVELDDAVTEPTRRPAVSVVIPTCGNAAALERSLASVLETRYEPLEVVIVENRPPAASTRGVAEKDTSGTAVVYLEEPRPGASWARNTGLARASADIVAFTDDDVVVDERWIDNGVAAFGNGADVACVTGRILPLSLDTPGKRLFDDFATLDKGRRPRVFRLPEARDVDALFPYTAGSLGSGANVFIRREVALDIGGFDPVLGTPRFGGEDLDLFIRLVEHGLAIAYDPTVVVFHDHPDSLEQLRHHAFRYGIGLTAMLTKRLLHGPGRLQLLAAIPPGVRYLLDPNSRKNVRKTSLYPRKLDVLEYFGMALGPFAYALAAARSALHDGSKLTDLRDRAGRYGRRTTAARR